MHAGTVRHTRAGRAATGAALVALVAALAACGSSPAPSGTAAPPASPTPPAAAAVDPAIKPYCDTVARVQAEQSSPQAGQGGVAVASATARRQLTALVATAPPSIAADWHTVQGLTERALGSLAATGGDPRRIDQRGLAALTQAAQPAVTRIKTVTENGCHVRFSAPGATAGH